jgi:predicted nucleic acid-binding protein
MVIVPRLIAIDSNVVIGLVEADHRSHIRVSGVLARLVVDGFSFSISEMAIAEAVFGAFRRDDRPLAARYLGLLAANTLFRVVPVDIEHLIEAAKLGGATGLKLLDAIHVEAALAAGAEAFLTADKRIRAVPGLAVIDIDDL